MAMGLSFYPMKKQKTYVITLSQVFPVTHIRKGEPTGFKDKFLAAIKQVEGEWLKLHTIRANYELWKKRFDEITAGKACLAIRQWTGRPYKSKQVELARLTREDGIGLQELYFPSNCLRYARVDTKTHFFTIDTEYEECHFKTLAYNDGLSFEDWHEWFKKYNLSKPLAIIHFTSFRY